MAASSASMPLGVAVLSVLLGLFGGVILAIGLLVLVASLLHVALGGATAAFGATLIAGLITLILGAIILGVAFGLWDQELWAFVLALIVVGVAFIWFVGRPIYAGEGASAVINLPAIFSGVLLIYLVLVSDHFY